MKLLHVITSMSPENGGPAQGIRTLNNAMLEMGVTREVACVDSPDSAYLGNDSFKIHALGPAKGPWCYSPELIGWLKNNILRFDVVMINGLWLYQSHATWKAIKILKKEAAGKPFPRILVMPHGMLDPYFQRASGRKLKAIRNWLYWKLIESKVINDADGLLFTCETELLLARETFKPYRPKKEYNVGYGVANPQPYNDSLSAAFNQLCPGLNGAPYLLFLSRLHQKKGVDLLIKAYINLHKNQANKTIPKLVIAGPGLDTPFGIMIQQLLENEPEIKKNIFFPGMLTGDAKWGAFYGCEAFVLPSHQENFGIAVAEALACGKPVLISNQVNIWREIMESGGGFIDNDDQEGVNKILKKWIALDIEEKAQMNNKALSSFQQYFTINKAAHSFFNAFANRNQKSK
jgi:glycosyltransferase involved in cell wall biosynthesis